MLAAGGDPAQVVFSGVGKTRDEMRRALEVGVLCFNVESEAELEHAVDGRAAAPARTAPVSLRVNPDVDAGTHPYISTGLKGNKFGIAHDEARAAYRARRALPGLEVVGIDCHIGSQITEIGPYLDALDRLLDLVEASRPHGLRIAPPRPRRRPGHHLHRRDAARRRRAGGRAAASASTRAAMAIARSCSSRAARWSATPACW